MSNIPLARRILLDALAGPYDAFERTNAIIEALDHLDRKKPAFVTHRTVKALTWRQKAKARHMREHEKMSLHDIAVRLGTNIGRVSEAINEVDE